ncbi:GlsB/YeaQ/YmgE family stress response membrane protein [Candidatus Saccharibacteria bacterium]|jgi:uncharacterized membrane protein YeaQ/YmgE (transglycosylase-associated protein family)|nr:GlsB/YeaQ/YmgE family stress response membrane protein [Candidatus Saccharibacteria bacterium]
MGILAWIIVGGLAGWVASIIMKTNEKQGALANVVVGVIGAMIGGWVMSLVGNRPDVMSFSIGSFLVALLGAVILLAILKVARK